MSGAIPLIHGSGGELNDALATAAGVPRSLHPQLDDASAEARERLHRVAAQNPCPGEVIPCSLQDIPGALGTAEYEPPQPEGTPAMQGNAEQSKDESTFPALLNELEELNSELQCELQCLDGAVDRLGAHSQPQDCEENSKAEAVPETHLARLHHQIIRLRNLRDETRELNRRLSEAV